MIEEQVRDLMSLSADLARCGLAELMSINCMID